MFYGLYPDPTWIIILPGILLALYAQMRVKSTFAKYSQHASRRGVTGAQAASAILRGRAGTQIAHIPGNLNDSYSPRENLLRLSDTVYGSTSIAALGVAAHEAGHALQHEEGYFPATLRSFLVPAANFGSTLSFPLILLGFVFSWAPLVTAGIAFFSVAVLFQLVTLPVEFDASRRALLALNENAILDDDELSGAQAVLRAAALTYLAAALTSMLQLMRLLLLSRRRD